MSEQTNTEDLLAFTTENAFPSVLQAESVTTVTATKIAFSQTVIL